MSDAGHPSPAGRGRGDADVPDGGGRGEPSQWRLRQQLARAGLAVVALALIFGVWNLVVWVFHEPAYVLPRPQSAVRNIVDNWSTFQPLTLQTLKETVFGYLIGAAVGFLLAVSMSALRPLQRILYPALIASQAVPVVAIAAPLVILLGFGMRPKLVIVAWWVFFPIAVNVLDGLANIDRDLLNLARAMGAGRVRGFLAIKLPATVTPLFTGLKIGATYAVSGAVIGEWTASSEQALGTYIQQANSSLNTIGVFAATMLLTAIGIASFLVVSGIEVIATPWRTRATARGWLARLRPAERNAAGHAPVAYPAAEPRGRTTSSTI
jgi:ABC-type nitrate/sulfonate/bicarbonate transport system permease component